MSEKWRNHIAEGARWFAFLALIAAMTWAWLEHVTQHVCK